eukprot:TRINITY_DN19619_c0_g1_i1.p1 TRINITY_DN19619_c0_g1~~TRINITY_DN19619_c0_g1_i1.p1  ORF type:complete len:423 (+),score=76.15 TRINITY_DN19619_c0_g1_i1:112-1269(+)
MCIRDRVSTQSTGVTLRGSSTVRLCSMPPMTVKCTALLLSVAICASSSVTPLSPEGVMAAYVSDTPAKDQYVASMPQPLVGSLHELYNMPAACEVLVRVHASSVNPSDISPTIARYPKVLGSDVAGVVEAVGPGCTRLSVGQAVWGDIGANTNTSNGTKTKELGAYAQHVVALETQLGVVPSTWSLAVAGALPKVALTSYKALVWYAGAPWKHSPTVLVLGGSGGTGGTGIMIARALGAGRIVTTTSSANADYCRSLGANVTIDYHAQDWWDPAVIADESVDVVYDTVGQALTGDRAMSKLRTGGAYVTITGQTATHAKPGVNQSMFINSDTNLVNFDLLDALADLGAKGQLHTRINTTFGLSQVADAFKLSATGHVVGKISIKI